MNEVRYDRWRHGNYHGTLTPVEVARWRVAFPAQKDGARHYRRAADAVRSVIAASPSRPLVALGSGWSFSSLLGGPGSVLDLSGVARLYGLAADDLASGHAAQAASAVLAGGACTLKQLNRFIEARGRALATSGSHNGPTVAGAIATGTHGAALDEGGFQNHARGFHLVTGSGPARWIAGAACWLPSTAFLHRLRCAATVDPALFAALQTHLGGLGILNAVMLETRPLRIFRRTTLKRQIGPAMLEAMSDGCFDDVASGLGLPPHPTYLEVTLDPHQPLARPAFLTFYHEELTRVSYAAPEPRDRLNLFAQIPGLDGDQPLIIPFDLWRAYALVFSDGEDLGSWGEFNGDHIPVTRGWHSAAFAVPRERLADAIATMSTTVHQLKPHFLFTVRFVSNADGTLAFCRFPETAVINIDGIPPALSMEPQLASCACQTALAAAGIRHGLHWGKLGALDAAKVLADYGDPEDQSSLRAAWNRAREALIAEADRDLFGNGALNLWKLA